MSKTKERIRESQLRYQQGLGQNFIYDDDLLEHPVSVRMTASWKSVRAQPA